MNALGYSIILLVLASACGGNHAVTSVQRGASRDVFPIHYEVRSSDHPVFKTRIDFSREYVSFSERDTPPESRARSEAAGTVEYTSNEKAYFIQGRPIVAPRPGVSEISLDGLSCRVYMLGAGFRTDCTDLRRNMKFSSFYIPSRGILWMDYFCTAHNRDVCRFTVGSEHGLFSPEMIDQLGLE